MGRTGTHALQSAGRRLRSTDGPHSVPALAILVLSATLAISLQAEVGSRSSPLAKATRVTVAVVPFEDRTTDPNQAHWRYVAAGLLKNQLDDVDAILLSSEVAVQYALRKLDLSAGDAVDPNLARAIGEYIEAQRVLWGSYQSQDGLWRLDARMLNVATGEVSAPFSAVAADWFDLRDSLNAQILQALGITPTEEERRKMAKRWTSSTETLAWYGKGYMLQEQGRPITEMEACFRKALAADPNCAPACGGLAAALANQGKSEPAEDLARRALQLDSDYALAHALLGFITASQRRFDEAKEAFRQACRLDRDDAEHLIHLAQIYKLEGKWSEAMAFLQMAVSLDPMNAMAHAGLAEAYAAGQDERAALHELQEAAYFMPERISGMNVHVKLAETYERLGRTSEAMEHYTQAVDLAGKLGMSPAMIRAMEMKARSQRNLLTPAFIEAAMPQRYTEQELDAILANRLSEVERQLVGNPFSCTEPMRRWAQELTREATTDIEKARAIFGGLAGRGSIRGQTTKSRTAREVFKAWNDPEVRLVCMDHAVLFVALARAVDVNAFFVQVTRDPDGTAMNHACAVIFDGDRVLLADSAQRWFGVPHEEYAILDDLQTAAFLCFNNRTGDAHPLSICQAGLKLWPESIQGKLQLTSLLLRADQPTEARRVLAEVGEPVSEGFEASAYWMAQGLLAEADGDVEQAEEHLQKTVALCSTQAGSHLQLGRICLQRGRLPEARTAFRNCLRNNPDTVTAGFARQLIAQINEEIGFEPSAAAVTAESASP